MTSPNRFNTEIVVNSLNSNRKSQKYQIISNGTQVWIYDTEQNQYSVGECKKFIQSPAGQNVGGLANFYLRTLDSAYRNRNELVAIAKSDPNRLARLEYFKKLTNLDLRNMAVRNKQIRDVAYDVYDIGTADESYRLAVYVSSSSNDIERIERMHQKDGVNLLSIEQIVRQSNYRATSDDIFTFIPPDNAEQVESPIQINSF